MAIRPLHDRVLIKRFEEENKTAGGIIIPDSNKEKPAQGEVVAVGEGHRNQDGSVKPLAVKVGDKVLFEKYARTSEVKHGGNDFLVMKEDDILAIID